MHEVTSSSGIRKTFDWIRDSGIIAVTIIGLILYFFLSIPATLFYAQLGTTPGEVGINYVNLLSSSTFELLVIFVALAAAVIAAGFLVTYIVMSTYAFSLYTKSYRGYLKASKQERVTRALDRNLKIYGKFPEYFQTRRMLWPDYPETIAEVETATARRLELLGVADLTPEQSAELARIESQLNFPRKARARKDFVRTFATLFLVMRHRIRQLAVPFAVTIVIVVLPLIAFFQAAQVRDGHAYFASGSGIFDYSADLVSVYPATPDSATSAILNLKQKRLFLLGENTVYAVLYSPEDSATIRIPIANVIISSVRS